jgi:LmbE family N-acetylglucosaminyl deacetylase
MAERALSPRGAALLAVFAHPDDETFRPGGTLALLAQAEVRVHLLTFTRGEAGSCGDPPLCTSQELATVRERELRCACGVLGIAPPRVLNYADGHLAEADAEPLITHILAAIQDTGAHVLLSFGPDGLSGHPDHVTVGRCAAEAFRRAENIAALYTVAVPASLAEALGMRQVRAVPDDHIALAVDASAVWETKLAAIRCHATQLGASPMMQAPVESQRRFFGVEHFVRAAVREHYHDCLPHALEGHLLWVM